MASAPGDYVHFKANVPLRRVSVGLKQWRYYDYGPKQVPPLICLSGVMGTADVFYKQVMFLGMKGYRVIAVDAPPVWSHQEWVNAFEKFLDAIDIHHVHLYGTELGGFLAQLFAQYRPRRVKSLMLSNTFLDTSYFADKAPWSSLINWTPGFILKRHILTGLPNQPQEPFIADSIDFVVSQLETLERDELASRLILKTSSASVDRLLLQDSEITIMDTNDYNDVPRELKNQLIERYPAAREAFLKTGGYFPFLSRPDEVNLHLQLHLRRVGVEGRFDLVKGPSRRDSAGNAAKNDDPSEGSGDSSKNSESPQAEDGSHQSTDLSKNSESPLSQAEDGSHPSRNAGSSDNVGDYLACSSSRWVEGETLTKVMHILQQYEMIFYLCPVLFSRLSTMINIVLMEVIAHGFHQLPTVLLVVNCMVLEPRPLMNL
uniref:Maspardin n=2 Tax=Araucaria cunninghamii TaxID=56994 RepID=A0A0D6R0I9_ARACU